MQFLTLNNGVRIPILGFGVYKIPKKETKHVVLDAIDSGYRLIDTAQSYFNEKEVGEAIAESGIDREELFITTKVLIDNYGYDKCKASVLKSLDELGLDYIDLVLLHQPFSDYYGAYRALEDLYEEGLIKAIGVSNFSPVKLTDMCLFERKVIPAVNQIETNPFNGKYFSQANMEKNGVQMAAWAPFGHGNQKIFENETIVRLAEKHDKTPAQIILRWLAQRSIVVISKSTHKERMAENINVFDFVLDEEDMIEIMELNEYSNLFLDYDDPETVEYIDERVESRKNK